MLKKIIAILASAIFVLNAVAVCAQDNNDRIHYIRTSQDLLLLETFPEDVFYLENDIIATGLNRPLCGDSGHSFSGVLDGKGYSITYLNIASEEQAVAFLGYSKGTIKSLNFLKCTINATSETAAVGGIVAYNSGVIEDCSFSGRIMRDGGDLYTSGIAAVNSGEIKKCTDYTSKDLNTSSDVDSSATSSVVIDNTTTSSVGSQHVDFVADDDKSSSDKDDYPLTHSTASRPNAEKYFKEQPYEHESQMSKTATVILTAILCVGLLGIGVFSIFQEAKIKRSRRREERDEE